MEAAAYHKVRRATANRAMFVSLLRLAGSARRAAYLLKMTEAGIHKDRRCCDCDPFQRKLSKTARGAGTGEWR
jgi:hypothetical protein